LSGTSKASYHLHYTEFSISAILGRVYDLHKPELAIVYGVQKGE